jgi:hypothetical protein
MFIKLGKYSFEPMDDHKMIHATKGGKKVILIFIKMKLYLSSYDELDLYSEDLQPQN